MRINTIMTAFLILLSSNLQASTPEGEDKKLTLEDCISKALESNYSVIISGNNLEITKNNVTLAPFLPTVTLGSRVSDSKLNQRNYSSQESIDNSVSKSTSVINSASLNWRLFDGLSMFASREKQIELLAQGEFNFRSVVENLIMKISTHYYQIISLQNQVNLLTELVAISQVRYNQALTRYNIGSDSGLEYKQAKIYLNSDSSRLMLQKENLKNGYLELYRMMNIPFDSNYIISDTIIPERQLNLNELLEMALEANTSLNSIRAGERVAQLDTKIATSSRYPTLDLSAGYNYNINRSQLFPSKFNESNGLNWGLSLSIPIFDGNEINRRIKSARIAQESARLNILMEEQNLESELRQLYNLYNNNLKLIEFEQESRESAYLNLEAAMEMYRLGSLSGIEFRDYQLSYLDASDRKLRALYQTKVSEITLHLMAGELFKER
ncbi:MAG TPA: TolC family protein [Rikenellaceae bacterium]|nr:TolC family protein [Rikenellaceae bacterium]